MQETDFWVSSVNKRAFLFPRYIIKYHQGILESIFSCPEIKRSYVAHKKSGAVGE